MAEPASVAPAKMSEPLLSVRGLNAFYGESHVLHGIDFDRREGEVGPVAQVDDRPLTLWQSVDGGPQVQRSYIELGGRAWRGRLAAPV